MKVRTGFVSNSSSSSFCIYGVSIPESDLPKYLHPSDKDAYDYFDGTPLSYHCPLGYTSYIGRSWSSIKDNQTGAEFKKETEELVKKHLLSPEDLKFGTLSEAWMD